MTTARRVVPAVLVYVRRGEEVLMIERRARPGDAHAGKWNGLGGKLEIDESPAQAARRELREESGLELPAEAFVALGFLQFPNFRPDRGEDWLVFVFEARLAEGAATELRAGDEGELHWVPADRVATLPLWEGDRHFIPWVLDRRPFLGTIWYEDGRVARHEMREIGGALTRISI